MAGRYMMPKAVILVLGLGAAFGVTSASAQDSALVANILEAGKVRAAVDFAPPNLILNSQTNQWEGVFVEFTNAWAEHLGVEVEYQQTSFANMVAAVQANRVDIALDLTINEERLKGAKFSAPVRGDVGVFLLGRAMPGVASYADLDNPEIRVCVQQGGVYDVALTPVGMKAQIQRLPNSAACFAALDSGRVDAMFWGWSVAAIYAKQNADRGAGIIFTPEPFVRSEIANAVSLNYTDEDIAPLNAFTQAWVADPEGLRASLRRWSGDAIPLDFAIGDIPQYVRDAVPGSFGRQE